jgi:hypothetical protein
LVLRVCPGPDRFIKYFIRERLTLSIGLRHNLLASFSVKYDYGFITVKAKGCERNCAHI